jgi:ADP-ribose pyrophosphatase YjhB (NUDIX family)
MARDGNLYRRAVRRFYHLSFLLRRPMTLGVRAVVLDQGDRVFLVRHGYTPGWHFPGGGVDTGESCLEAMARELEEEGHIRVTGPARLHGFFFNREASRRDHVAVYVVRDFECGPPRPPDWEIQESGFFDLNTLPEGVTRGTRDRLAEIFGRTPPPADW